jgi:hypothetical protein
MLTEKELRERLEANPFKPFTVRLSDGRSYPITNHDMMWVRKNSVYIGINGGADGLGDYAVQCAILHITSVEDIVPGAVRSTSES